MAATAMATLTAIPPISAGFMNGMYGIPEFNFKNTNVIKNDSHNKKRKRSALGEGWDAEVDDDWDGWEPEEADDPMDIEEDTEDEGEDEGEEEEDDEKEDPTYIPKWDRG